MAGRTIGHFDDDDFSGGPAMPVLPELLAGETIVWTGRPRSVRRLLIRTIPNALFGLAFLVFTLFWMASVAHGGLGKRDKGRVVAPFERHNVVIAAFVGLWAIPPGLYMLTWPLWTWRRLKATCYAVTDRRAIICEPGLLGQSKIRSYAADSLRLMRLEEHADGTGDLIFENPSNWVGITQTVGYLAIAEVREVEALVHRTLMSTGSPRSQSPGHAAAGPARAMSERKTYRLPLGIRLVQFVFLAVGLLAAVGIIANLVLSLATLIRQPNILFSLIARLDLPSAVGAVASPLVGVLVGWGFSYFALAFPIEITVDPDGTVSFRSRLRTVTMPVGEITSIRTGGWADPNKFNAVVRHKGGKLTLINQFADFRDFLAALRVLNPNVEIKGF